MRKGNKFVSEGYSTKTQSSRNKFKKNLKRLLYRYESFFCAKGAILSIMKILTKKFKLKEVD